MIALTGVNRDAGGATGRRSAWPRPWPRRRFGGSSGFHAVPGLNPYWHRWLLGGRATGRATLGDEVWDFTDAEVGRDRTGVGPTG